MHTNPKYKMSVNYVPPGVAASRLGISPTTLAMWLKAGKIKAIIMPGGQRRYDLDSVVSPSVVSRSKAGTQDDFFQLQRQEHPVNIIELSE
jgi:excisionase family DNA binding protein